MWLLSESVCVTLPFLPFPSLSLSLSLSPSPSLSLLSFPFLSLSLFVSSPVLCSLTLFLHLNKTRWKKGIYLVFFMVFFFCCRLTRRRRFTLRCATFSSVVVRPSHRTFPCCSPPGPGDPVSSVQVLAALKRTEGWWETERFALEGLSLLLGLTNQVEFWWFACDMEIGNSEWLLPGCVLTTSLCDLNGERERKRNDAPKKPSLFFRDNAPVATAIGPCFSYVRKVVCLSVVLAHFSVSKIGSCLYLSQMNNQ